MPERKAGQLEPPDAEQADIRAALLEGKREGDRLMFYRGSYVSYNHRDPCTLRFLGPDGARKAMSTKP